MNGQTDKLAQLGIALRQAAGRARQRRMLVLAGGRAWGAAGAGEVLAAAGLADGLWVGAAAPAGMRQVEPAQCLDLLGSEQSAVVFDVWSGFDPDAFGAISGTVRGSGLLLLLCPPLAEWPAYADPERARITVAPHGPEAVSGRYLRRLVRVIREAEEACLVEQGGPLPTVRLPEAATLPEEAGPCRSTDQRRAVEAVRHVVHGHRRRPLVLTSDRGRGKSSALGIAAAGLLEEGLESILVTAPRLEAVAPLFAQAARLLSEAQGGTGALHFHGRALEFVPPDELVRHPRPARLLLVDEAAAIPAPLLERLLEHYHRMVFATTVHGYEGTGRGFAVRFQQVLEQRTPGWRGLHLEQPIRWAAGDPVERFVFRALLLDAAPAAEAALDGATAENCSLERLGREQLAADETSLGELFGLLVLAHYRTRPLDLRHLLDGPNLEVYVLCYEGHVAATALVAREGGFDESLAYAVWAGERRPHGHMLPESLAAHSGLREAPCLRGARIMRITVHPAVQRRGLGRALLAGIAEAEAAAGMDYLGSSFGATAGLLRFWQAAGYRPARLSVKRGASSGSHSAIVLRPLSAAGEALCASARQHFVRELPRLLGDPLRGLEPSLAALLLRGEEPLPPPALSARDWLDLVAFAWGRRIYESVLEPAARLVLHALAEPDPVPQLDVALLIARVVQQRSWAEAAEVAGLPGRRQVVDALRTALRRLIVHYGDEAVQAEAERLARRSGEPYP